MTVSIDLQNDENLPGIPQPTEFLIWVKSALLQNYADLEQSIRIVTEAESRDLNKQFRDKDCATNILSFPAQLPYLDYQCLGDLVICAPLVEQEATQQGKEILAHWAHLVVHGMLHLQGHDHENEADAIEMEAREVEILATLGYSNPYGHL